MVHITLQVYFLILTQLWLFGSAQDCLRPANTQNSLPNFEDLGGSAGRISDGNGAQVIVTGYQFHCCGDIAGWAAYVRPDGKNHQDGAYSINFQVWRPSPTVGSDGAGEYSLVGENRFTSIMFPDGDPVRGTPQPTSVISVRPGDVVGFFQSSSRGGDDGIQLEDSSFSHDRLLWYQTSFSQGSLSTLVAGSGGSLVSSTNAGVQLSVDISSSACTPLPTPPPTTPPPTTPPPTTPPPTAPPPTTPPPTTPPLTEPPPTTPPPTTPPPTEPPPTTPPPTTPPITVPPLTTDSEQPITEEPTSDTPPPTTTGPLATTDSPSTEQHTTNESITDEPISTDPPATNPPTTERDSTAPSTTGQQTDQSSTSSATTNSLPTPSQVQGPQPTALPTTDRQATQLNRGETGATDQNDQSFPPRASPSIINIGLVAGLVVVIVLLLIASAIIAAIVVMRYRKAESKNLNNQTRLNNPLHDEGTGRNLRQPSLMKPMTSLGNLPEIPSDGITNIGYRNHCFQESLEESKHYYSAIGASTDPQVGEKTTLHKNDLVFTKYDVCFGQEYLEPKDQSGIYDEPILKEPASPEYEDIYMVPGSDEATLYAQLADIKADTLTRKSLRLGNFLGSGQFGTVYKGLWQSSTKGNVEVAVKTLNEGSTQEDKIKFLQEAAIMGQFKHPNVVEMYGVITDKEPILLVLEMLKKGDLRAYLLKMRNGKVSVDDHTLLSYCRQVASGMDYLSNKAFVHRDLAARNILVSEDDTCKIADFGMSRDLMDESYYVSHGGKIPVKWTAPEALHYKKYSTASDVWSYGALMYEIWSVGHKPFEKFANIEIIKKVDSGYRLPPPPGCPRGIYSIMIQCWHPATSKRPDFNDIYNQMTSCPDAVLLKWSEEDRQTHPDADKLGADLDFAQNLYLDLQALYEEKSL